MPTLDVDWGDLELAFRDATGTQNHIDLDTGEILSVVPGFSDADDLLESIAKEPDRFVQIAPLTAAHAREVMGRFLERLDPSRRRQFAASGLLPGNLGPGGLTKCLALLREDEVMLARYYRFEQTSFWAHIESFLTSAGISPSTRTPGVELFEGHASRA